MAVKQERIGYYGKFTPTSLDTSAADKMRALAGLGETVASTALAIGKPIAARKGAKQGAIEGAKTGRVDPATGELIAPPEQRKFGYSAGALHGDLSQNQRDLVMNSFRKNQIQMLVATDVAARGIDVDDITHVINYNLPDEIEVYTHRSGRTARAGKKGTSIVIMDPRDMRKLRPLEKIINQVRLIL